MRTKVLSSLFLIMLSAVTFNANASPAFAKQYSAHCGLCHTKAPSLNSNGLSFLRQGFRFSKSESSAMDLLLAKDGKERKYPIAILLGADYSSEKDSMSVGAKLFLTGSITKDLSFFGVTKQGLVNSDNDNMKFFKEESTRAFFQYNPDETSHVVTAGLLSPLSQYGNLQRASAASGLQDAKPDDLPGKFKYRTPIQEAKVERIKGAQYSYLTDNRILVSLAYGAQVDGSARDEVTPIPGSGGSGGGSGSGPADFDDSSNSLTASLRYETLSGYQVGVIYNQFKERDEDAYSLLFPLEKTFDKFSLNSTLVYKNNDVNGEYYGWENAAIFPVEHMTTVKAIANLAIDEDDNSEQGYHLSYNKMFNKYLMGSVSAIYIDTEYQNTNSINTSIHLAF